MAAFESESDEELLGHIQSGNHNAFAVLVKRHSGRFFRLAYRFTGSSENAEDMVQDCFIKLWERPDIWQPKNNVKFTTWFYRVVVNKCLDLKKKPAMAMLEDDVAGSDPANDDFLIKKEEQRALEGAILKLPERQRTALNLCFYEELSNQEAADIMGLKLKALQSLLMRAKTTLKEQMQNYL